MIMSISVRLGEVLFCSLVKDSSQAVSQSSSFPQSAGYQRHITVESFWLEINRSFLLGTHVRCHQQLSHLQSIVEVFCSDFALRSRTPLPRYQEQALALVRRFVFRRDLHRHHPLLRDS
jgi:hypothetical protein